MRTGIRVERVAYITFGLVAAIGALRATAHARQDRGRLQNIVVHGASLERNALGVSADRAVSVYLPPSYGRGNRRYPVVYLLHGIMDSPSTWTQAWGAPHPPNPGFATIQDLMDQGITKGALQEMIVVMPDADKTCHYTDSPVKGGWASFIAKDLVQHIDRTYRTVAAPHARGILGHSMGGHGALKLAMIHPGVFSTVYAMNPSMLGWGGDVSSGNSQLGAMASISRLEDVAQQNFYVQAVVGIGQCFAPDVSAPLKTPALFVGNTRGPAYDHWAAQMPIYMAPRYADALRALRGLRFDSAFEDEFSHIPVTSRAMSAVLDSLGVDHTFEMYNGDHRNRLWGQQGRLFTAALPFMSHLLTVSAPPKAVAANPGDRAAAQEALWAAARSGNTRRAADAIAAGADISAIDTVSNESGGPATGRRALNYAALHNRASMVKWLVERGAQLNLPNRSGFTPLHHAAESGAYNSAEALLALGADPNAMLPSGSTPLSVARQRGQSVVAKLLEPVTKR